MILSVSRRTDIPAFYSEWFMNRIHEGYALVRNPMNYHQVSKVSLDPKVIDCIVFWTKNAAPIIRNIEEISEIYPFYFQYTLNAYHNDIESAVSPMKQKIDTISILSDKIGTNKVIWRYDPILLTNYYTVEWHIEQFEQLATMLKDKTNTCVFSFIDIYDKVKNNVNSYNVRACTIDEMNRIASAFSSIAHRNGLRLRTCAEAIDLDQYGIEHGCCIDGELISEITGWNLKAKKDPNQRSECGCLESIDIGQYNTCKHGCRYCYANFNAQSVITFSKQHNPNSPLLIGSLEEQDSVTERKMKSLRCSIGNQQQMTLFDI